MFAALLCASLAARGAALVPARADAVLFFDGDAGLSGLREFLEAAGARSRALSPRELSRESSSVFGADLLSGAPGWGLDPRGVRALVFAAGTLGLNAPVRDGKAARRALLAWIGAAGTVSKRGGAKTPIVAGWGRSQRAGIVASQAGTVRLFTATGRAAEAMIVAMTRVGARRSPSRTLLQDKELASLVPGVQGKAALVVRGEAPITWTVLGLEADRSGVVARGLVGAPSPLLDGHAPDASACSSAALFCLRASPGPSGKDLVALASRLFLSSTSAPGPLADLLQQEASQARSVVVASDGIDVGLLAGAKSPLWALRLVALVLGTTPRDAPIDLEATDGPRKRCLHAEASAVQISSPCAAPRTLREGDGPALQGSLDPVALDAALSRLNAFDALLGSVPAALVGTRLLAGGFLRGSAPASVTGDPDPLGARVELRWSLR